MRNWSEAQIILFFLRHGATESNRQRRYLGRSEEGLSPEGRKRLLVSRDRGGYPAADLLFAGPMRRCRETAGLLYPDTEMLLIPEWTEIDFGRFEGKGYEELKEDPDYLAWLKSGGCLPFPGGESREEFVLRCERGFERMTELLRERLNKRPWREKWQIGAVVHGGTIMALMSAYCGGDYFDYQVSNGEGYLCRLKLF